MIAGAIALLTPTQVKAQVGLNPMVIQSEISRGQAQSVITVTNPSAQPMRVRVYAEPFTYDRDTGFTTLTEDVNDLTPYLQFSPREFVVPPNEKQRVRVVGLLPPSLLETEYRAVIFTEALPENTPSGESIAGIQTRIGSTVYFRQADTEPALSVMNSEWDAENKTIQLLVSNQGDTTARPNIRWTLRRGEESVATGASGSTTVIEGGDRLFQLSYINGTAETLTPGTYELSGELVWRFGTEQSSQPFSTSLVVR